MTLVFLGWCLGIRPFFSLPRLPSPLAALRPEPFSCKMPKADEMSAASPVAAHALRGCGDHVCSPQRSRCYLQLHVLRAEKLCKEFLVIGNRSPFTCTLPWSCSANADGFGSRCEQRWL